MTNTIYPNKYYTTTTSTTTPNPVDNDFTIHFYSRPEPKLYPQNGQDTEYYAFEDAKQLNTFVSKSLKSPKAEPKPKIESTFETFEKPMIDLESAKVEPKIDSKVDISQRIIEPKIEPRNGNFLEFEAKNVPSTFYDVPLAPQDAVVNLDVPNENPIFDEVHFHHDPVNPVFQPISIANILEESSEETTTEITEEEDTTDFSNDDFLDAMEIEDSAATEQPGLKPLTVKLKLQGGKIKELVAISVLPVEVKEDFKPRKETGKLENRDIYR